MKRQLNLNGINYWTNQPFHNRMRGAGMMNSANQQTTTIAEAAYFLVPLQGDENRPMTILWDGDGSVDISVQQKQRDGVNALDFVYAGGNSPMVSIRGDVKNIRIVPESEEHLDIEFKPEFVEELSHFDACRGMEFLGTNVTNLDYIPEDRDPLDYGSIGTLGEFIRLCNAANVMPWVNFPHRTTRENVGKIVAYVETHSKRSGLGEWGNEVWNSQFQVARYLEEQAPGATHAFIGARNAEIQAAASGTRFKLIIASQFVNPWHLDMILDGFVKAGGDPTQLAAFSPTSYVDGGFTDYVQNPEVAWSFVQSDDVLGALKYIEDHDADFIRYMQGYVDRARKYGIEVWVYEGGMFHLNCNYSAHDWNQLRSLYYRMQMHPYSVNVLQHYEKLVEDAGVGMQGYFDYASLDSEWGFFGISLQPIWQVLMAQLRGQPAPDPLPLPAPEPTPVQPTPAPAPTSPMPDPIKTTTKAQVLKVLTPIDKSITAVRVLVNGKKVDPAKVQQALDRTSELVKVARETAGGYTK